MTSLHKATCCVLHKNSIFCDAREPTVGYPALLVWIHSDTELQPSQPGSLVLTGEGDSKGMHTQPECRSSARLNSGPRVSTPHSTHSRVCSTWLLGSGSGSDSRQHRHHLSASSSLSLFWTLSMWGLPCSIPKFQPSSRVDSTTWSCSLPVLFLTWLGMSFL